MGQAVHCHMPALRVRLQVKDGLVQETSVQMVTLVPKGFGPGWRFDEPAPGPGYVPYWTGDYSLLSKVETTTRPIESLLDWPEEHQRSYEVREPSGCTICISITASFRPEADETLERKLGAMNWACMTQWGMCTKETDTMPAAWREYEAESRLRRAQYEGFDKGDYPFAQLYGGC